MSVWRSCLPSSLGLGFGLISPKGSLAEIVDPFLRDHLISLWAWEVQWMESHSHFRDGVTEVKRSTCSTSN